MRSFGRLLFAVSAAAVSVPAFAEPAQTTRIETRPIYGAAVTIEQGVRVFRPVPPDQHLIVNPEKVPLVLSIEDPSSAPR